MSDVGGTRVRGGAISAEQVEAYLGYVERADLAAAVSQIRGLVEDGVPVPTVVRELLTAVQVEVGRRWQCNEWSIAQEHAATAVSDAALGAIVADTAGGAGQGSAVVVCAEDEWHILPARMLSVLLGTRGVDATFLGGSVPGDHLRSYLESQRPTAVVISVTVPLHLSGAARTIRAAHEAGAPTIVGGTAFGSTPERAQRLGAAAWAADAEDAAALIAAWDSEPPVLPPSAPIPEEAVRLAEDRHDLVVATMMALIEHIPRVADFTTAQISRTHEDLDFILRFAEAAQVVDDERVFHDFVDWTREVLGSRGLPEDTLPRSLRALLDVLRGRAFPRTEELIHPHAGAEGAT